MSTVKANYLFWGGDRIVNLRRTIGEINKEKSGEIKGDLKAKIGGANQELDFIRYFTLSEITEAFKEAKIGKTADVDGIIYRDGIALVCQNTDFHSSEEDPSSDLERFDKFFTTWRLKLDIRKRESACFHLFKRQRVPTYKNLETISIKYPTNLKPILRKISGSGRKKDTTVLRFSALSLANSESPRLLK